jgi:uncharacterized protein (TIGR04255 family)
MPWRPAHQTHAIERVNLTIQFAEPVPARAWQPTIDDATIRLQGAGFGQAPLPAVTFGAPGVQIVFGPSASLSAAQGQAAPQPSANRAFVLIEDGQPREEVQITRQQLVFGVNRYMGWESLCGRLGEVFRGVIEKGLEISPASLIKLEYWDRFSYDGEPNEADYSNLLTQQSGYVPNFVFGIRDVFHSHSGHFLRHEPSKRLLNINIDVGDVEAPLMEGASVVPGAHRSAGIYTMCQDTFSDPVQGSLDFEGVMSALNEMHSTLKTVLGDVITEQMSSRISLFQGDQA